ncbi:proteasome accessory factor PafA2 family protein [Buchananella felis]|uniref:proteasome accessory factor PafA2 family protein n=1 Tax=Buchananella felis TaxID=3231492 RepID=UPI0035295C81
MTGRIIGTETEYGILRASGGQSHVLATALVEAYAGLLERPVTRWDYAGEDPLCDLRGHRLDRAAAHPSQLTDASAHRGGMVSNGHVAAAPQDFPVGAAGGTSATLIGTEALASAQALARPSRAELALPHPGVVITPAGARFYVDHAHPEYSGGECDSVRAAVAVDRAGDLVAQRAADALGDGTVVYKNNTDGKGAAYGSHENYQVRREVDLDDLISVLTPFLVTRPILCGTGRLGRGQRSQQPGFQLSQRADFIENDIGLETTFNRPIFNTRDEPHADAAKWRRLHVINGDANQFEFSTFLRLGTTALVLDMIEAGAPLEVHALALASPLRAVTEVSYDTTLTQELELQSSRSATAIEIQRAYRQAVIDALGQAALSGERAEILHWWGRVLDLLETDRDAAAPYVEWVAKLQLLEGMRQRLGGDWAHPRLAALDLQWHDLCPQRSLVARLDAAGRVAHLLAPGEAEAAVHASPCATRARVRGEAVEKLPVVAASWTSVILDFEGDTHLRRVALPEASGAALPELLVRAYDVLQEER